MNVGFTRTRTGIVGKWRFYSVPTVWVEGPTDIFFFAPIVDDLECRIEAFHGKENAKALIGGLVDQDFPYLVVLDGDYGILSKRRTVHKRVIFLERYSFENYLWESDPINRACHRCAQSGDRDDVVGPEYNRVNQHLSDVLREIIEVDVAARRSDPAPKVLPDRVESLLVDARRPEICPQKVALLMDAALDGIDEGTLASARFDVRAYLRNRRLADLLKGHVLFGLLRLVFTRTASTLKGRKVIVDDDALIQLLADAVWRQSPSRDHKVLRLKVRKWIRELVPLCKSTL